MSPRAFRGAGSTGGDAIANVSRALSSRLDYTKTQYRRELEPLQLKLERLNSEIIELREARSIFVEETSALNNRNDQMADLNALIAQEIQNVIRDGAAANPQLAQLIQDAAMLSSQAVSSSKLASVAVARPRKVDARERAKNSPSMASFGTSNTLGAGSTNTYYESADEFGGRPSGSTVNTFNGRAHKMENSEPASVQKKTFKWFGPGGARTAGGPGGIPSGTEKPATSISTEKVNAPTEKARQHVFVGTNILRISRCDHCSEKLWGAALRCTSEYYVRSMRFRLCSNRTPSGCNFACHTRCAPSAKSVCKQIDSIEESAELVPARELPQVFRFKLSVLINLKL